MIHIKIFYGSQTGNSHDVAEKIYRYSTNLSSENIKSEIFEMNSLEFNTITKDDIVIFVCSTTGQGDPPINMKLFWKLVMSRSFSINLSSLNFAIFGLGDSKYKNYNFIAKKLYRRLMQFKAKPIISLGLADDQHPLGVDGEFSPWIRELWAYLKDKLTPFSNVNNWTDDLPLIKPIMKYDASLITSNSIVDKVNPLGFDTFCLQSITDMTPADHFQDTKLVTFFNNSFKYEAGDIFTVYPQNNKSNTDLFFELTNMNKNEIIEVKSHNSYFSIPEVLGKSTISIADLVSHCFDLNAVPRKSFFENFAYMSTFDIEKERLLELSDSKNIDELYTYCFQPKRTIVEVLRDFPNTTKRLTITQWLNLMPFILPRDYSIASSYNVHKQQIQLLIARVTFKSKMHEKRIGLCSNFLCDLKLHDKVAGRIKKGTLKFPNVHGPVILISPGTGIAAFRGFISERMLQKTSADTLLCFGNRYRSKDFYFSQEFEQLEKDEKLQMLTSFSREEKIYIQNKLKQKSELISAILTEMNGFLYICGRSVDMPQQVHDAIKNILVTENRITEIEAESVLFTLQRLKRYQIETWS